MLVVRGEGNGGDSQHDARAVELGSHVLNGNKTDHTRWQKCHGSILN